jgi:hypothetical protein
VPKAKLSDYLLSETHPVGRLKSKFFRSLGYSEGNVELLEHQLLAMAHDLEVDEVAGSAYGRKFLIEGNLHTPAGQTVRVRAIWLLEIGDERPRFITAYPAN